MTDTEKREYELGRMMLADEINSLKLDRPALEETYGQVWDTEEVKRDFTAHAFLAPFVQVTRKSDGVKGVLTFQHLPRFYFSFTPVNK